MSGIETDNDQLSQKSMFPCHICHEIQIIFPGTAADQSVTNVQMARVKSKFPHVSYRFQTKNEI